MTPEWPDTAESMGIKIGPTVRKLDWYPFVAYGLGLNGEGRILIRENFITVSAGDDGWKSPADPNAEMIQESSPACC